jgi:hypothetical protein
MKVFIVLLAFVLSSCSIVDTYSGIDVWNDSRYSTFEKTGDKIELYNNAKIKANYLLEYYYDGNKKSIVINMGPLEKKTIDIEPNAIFISFVIHERIGISIK